MTGEGLEFLKGSILVCVCLEGEYLRWFNCREGLFL